MRISERNIPLLKYLKWKGNLNQCTRFCKDEDFLFGTPYDEAHQLSNGVNAIRSLAAGWGKIAGKYATLSIDLPSKEFIEAMDRSQKSFEKMLSDYTKDRRITGVFIGPTRQTAFLYDFQNFDGLFEHDPEMGRGVYKITGKGPEDAYCQFIVLGAKCDTLQAYVDTKEGIYFVTKDPELWLDAKSAEEYLALRLGMVILYEMFKKYAKVETKVVNRKSRNKSVGGERCVNETEFDLNYVDCTWFTTIVRTEGFKVRGHFRLQPKKDAYGEWTRELIYINEFEKHGYTRMAKMLSEPDCEPQFDDQ